MIPVKLYTKLFDVTIKPILLYCSEVWVDETIHSEKSLLSLNTPTEKVHLKFLKTVLKVGCKATNLACLLEMGRYPLIIHSVKQMIKYWFKLKNSKENTLIHEAYKLGLQMDKEGINNWISGLIKVLHYLELDYFLDSHSTQNESSIIKQIINKLEQNFRTHSHQSMHNDNKGKGHKNKLRTYRLLKNDFIFEDYLTHVRNPSHRSAMTKLRVSAHTLQVEMGRYKNLELEKRKCTQCDLEEIEDEKHFLLKCKLYKKERDELFNNSLEFPANQNYTDEEIMVKILTNKTEQTITKIAKFIHTCFSIRERSLVNCQLL